LNRIGLIVALRRELPAGFVCLQDFPSLDHCPLRVYRSALACGQHLAVHAGMGSTRAEAAARLLVRQHSPQALISFGFAGGLGPDLGRGTLVIGTQVVVAAPVRRVSAADRELVEQFYAAAQAEAVPVQRGRLVTTPRIVPDPMSKAALRASSGACAVDMESAGIAAVAEESNLPWTAVRAIVDDLDDTLPAACLPLLRADGRIAIGQLLYALWRSPALLRQMLRLARSATVARRHLSHTFTHWATHMAVACPSGHRRISQL
jgi:adenosylhomocysteine nucleosidase